MLASCTMSPGILCPSPVASASFTSWISFSANALLRSWLNSSLSAGASYISARLIISARKISPGLSVSAFNRAADRAL